MTIELKKCFYCTKLKFCPVKLTEIKEDGTVVNCDVCQKCADIHLEKKQEAKGKMQAVVAPDAVIKKKNVDVSHINTPQELLAFLMGTPKPGSPDAIPPCECSTTEAEFDETGRFGCPRCYTHFETKMKEQVFPFHGACEHVGKRPKRSQEDKWMSDPVEKEKVLKLRLARAVEVEDYERAAELKKQLAEMKVSGSDSGQSPP